MVTLLPQPPQTFAELAEQVGAPPPKKGARSFDLDYDEATVRVTLREATILVDREVVGSIDLEVSPDPAAVLGGLKVALPSILEDLADAEDTDDVG